MIAKPKIRFYVLIEMFQIATKQATMAINKLILLLTTSLGATLSTSPFKISPLVGTVYELPVLLEVDFEVEEVSCVLMLVIWVTVLETLLLLAEPNEGEELEEMDSDFVIASVISLLLLVEEMVAGKVVDGEPYTVVVLSIETG